MPSVPGLCTPSSSHSPLPEARRPWQEERDPPSEPLPHLHEGDTNRTHTQGIPGGITRDLPTHSQLPPHTSWGCNVCPFQLK